VKPETIDELERLLASPEIGEGWHLQEDDWEAVYDDEGCHVAYSHFSDDTLRLLVAMRNALPDLLRERRELRAKLLERLATRVEDDLLDYDLTLAWDEQRDWSANFRGARLVRHWAAGVREGRIG
jgi:hypothetical protein